MRSVHPKIVTLDITSVRARDSAKAKLTMPRQTNMDEVKNLKYLWIDARRDIYRSCPQLAMDYNTFDKAGHNLR